MPSPVPEKKAALPGVRRNLIANFMGKGWTAVMSLAFIPLYIKLMGIEAYGLIGFNLTLVSVLSLLDMGLSATLNRELARLSVLPDGAQSARNLVRTLEVVYWPVTFLIALGGVVLSPYIAEHWIQARHLPIETVRQAVLMMWLSIALQWPYSFYEGGLLGLERQTLLNGVAAFFATVRGAGAVLALKIFSPSILTYFGWQILVSALTTVTVCACLWRSLPHTGLAARFDRVALAETWRFALGMTGVTAVALVLMQTDKIVLSRLLPLQMFGYYMLANNVAGAIGYIVLPFFTALFPRFTRAVARHDQNGLIALYHQSCQALSVAILPVAVVMAVFSSEILLLWTHNPVVASHTHGLVSLLVIGWACNGLINIPYAVQLAFGNTKLAFWANVIGIVVLAPVLFWLVRQFGAVGAAAVWLMLNVGYVLISIPVFHRRLLPGEMGRWYLWDVGAPLLAALAVTMAARVCLPPSRSPLMLLIGLAGVLTLAILAAAFAAPQIRGVLMRFAPIRKTA